MSQDSSSGRPEFVFSQPGIAMGGDISGLNFSIAAPPLETPVENALISPEIGPDPRNSNATVRLPDPPVCGEPDGVRFDFNYGCRLKMPPGDGEYEVTLYDLDSLVCLGYLKLRGGENWVADAKYFIRYRIEVRTGGKLIFEHDYDCTGKRVSVVVPDGGLGDNLAWMPFAEEFRKKHRAKVDCVCGEWLIRIVGKLYPELNFIPVASSHLVAESYATYFCAIFPKDRKSWRPADHQNFGMQGSVAMLLGLVPKPLKLRLPKPPVRRIKEPYVCISAMATNPAKYWNWPDGWNTLCRFLKRLGYRVLAIDRDRTLQFETKKYEEPSEAEDFTGKLPLADRIKMLQNADFFIGLPSGLSWLAWNCDTPVVMISGFSLEGTEFPTPYRVTNFKFCHGCWNDSQEFFDMSVPVWCPRHVGTPREIECTRVISPKMVIDTVCRIPSAAKKLEEARRRNRRIRFDLAPGATPLEMRHWLADYPDLVPDHPEKCEFAVETNSNATPPQFDVRAALKFMDAKPDCEKIKLADFGCLDSRIELRRLAPPKK
ncbi:MAG: autotransporter strand-loop-strand O-heptosyltransferase [Victivallaceae bacterium]|nr:autotransporter strand-loop-strand O-heptosyltransferase [Victivallaceae bacterium]